MDNWQIALVAGLILGTPVGPYVLAAIPFIWLPICLHMIYWHDWLNPYGRG